MRRRHLLAALPLVVAGCAAGPTDDRGAGDTSTEPPTDETTTDGDPTTTDGDPTAPDDDRTTSPTDPAAYPDYGEDVDRLVGYEQGGEDPPILLSPSAAEASLPDASLSFTLRNRRDQTFNTNFYGWVLHKRVDGDWYRVAPRYWPQPLMRMEPDGTHTWTLELSSTDPGARRSAASGTDAIDLVGIGAGTYAFGVDGWFEDGDYESKVAAAARFELRGDPLSLSPSDAVTDVTRDGDVVTVEAANADGERAGTYRLTRAEDPDDVRELITEQVVRRWPLRDALAHAGDGVREVRVSTRTTTHPAFGVQDDEPAVRYDGRTWAVSASAEAES